MKALLLHSNLREVGPSRRVVARDGSDSGLGRRDRLDREDRPGAVFGGLRPGDSREAPVFCSFAVEHLGHANGVVPLERAGGGREHENLSAPPYQRLVDGKR